MGLNCSNQVLITNIEGQPLMADIGEKLVSQPCSPVTIKMKSHDRCYVKINQPEFENFILIWKFNQALRKQQ